MSCRRAVFWLDDAIREVARIACMLNKEVENIGARRLHAVIERVMEPVSFEASAYDPGQEVEPGPERTRAGPRECVCR